MLAAYQTPPFLIPWPAFAGGVFYFQRLEASVGANRVCAKKPHELMDLETKMNFLRLNSVRAALIAASSILGASTCAHADIKDYEFQLVEANVKAGEGIISVRLVHLPDGKPVPGAVIFASRLDMAPEGMEAMTTSIEALPSTEVGVYRFKVNLTMQGGWQLSLGAKVQGEAETLEKKLVLKATP